jgi:hypothetical protein
MSLWDAMLCGWIASWSLHRADCSLTSHSSLELSLHLLRAALLEGIGAPTHSQVCDREQDREGLHLLILRTKCRIARVADV